jgi:integrase
MAKARLTDRAVQAARTEPGRRLEIWDMQASGLCLRISAVEEKDGTVRQRKVWVWRYRTADGRQPRLTLGNHTPAYGLADARADADRRRVEVRDGADPAGERRRAKTQALAQPIKTFDDLAEVYFGACERGEWTPKGKVKRARTLDDDKAVNRRYVKPVLGSLRLEEIGRAGVRKLLRDMVARGINAQTNRTQAFIRQVFAYAIAEFEGELVAINPGTGFSPVGMVKPRTRILSDGELKSLWEGLRSPATLKIKDGRTCDAHVSRPVAIILQVALLLLQRKSEVAGMRLSELDLVNGAWNLPPERMKGGVSHMVVLPPKAVELIKEAIGLRSADKEDHKSDVVFQSPRDASKPIRGDSVSAAMSEITAALGLEDATAHDLRRTGATLMTSERLGIAPFLVSRVLGHRSDTGGAAAVTMAHYAIHEFTAEKRRALEAWEGLLLEIVGERDRPSNVRSMRGAAG